MECAAVSDRKSTGNQYFTNLINFIVVFWPEKIPGYRVRCSKKCSSGCT